MATQAITDFYYSEEPMRSLHDRHKHNGCQMLYIVQGNLMIEIAGNRIECSAPALVFIGSHEPHLIAATSDPYVRYVLTLDSRRIENEIKPELLQTVFTFHPAGFPHVLDASPIADEVRMLMDALYSEWMLSEENTMPGICATLLSALLCLLYRHSPSHFAKKSFGTAEILVASVRMELENNFASKLDLDALAAQHHVSRFYLAHAFKRVTGYSLKSYLMLCRISYACQQLAEADWTVGEIAEASGFRDKSNFSRAFKAMIGMSPSQFRKQAGSFGSRSPLDTRTRSC